MMNETTLGTGVSPTPSPRVIGVVWLLYFVTAILSAVLVKGIVVTTDAAATANNIVTHAARYRAGISLDLVANLVYIALTVLLFGFFRRVNPVLALLAAFFSLVGCTVQIVGGLLRLAPSVLLADPQWAHAFGMQQVQGAALLSITLYSGVFSISFVLFACFELVTGFLILESTFLPKWLGWWWIVGGIAWLTFLWPPLAKSLWFGVLAAGSAELWLMLWLLVKGGDHKSRSEEITRN